MKDCISMPHNIMRFTHVECRPTYDCLNINKLPIYEWLNNEEDLNSMAIDYFGLDIPYSRGNPLECYRDICISAGVSVDRISMSWG